MTFESLVLSPTTRRLLDAYVQHPSQGVILTGAGGSGLFTTARAIAENITSHTTDSMIVQPDEKGTITIERVRALYVETRSVRSTHFVIIIDNMDAMGHEAQNSFLKLLEEPVDNVYFVLTTHEPQLLLPTILSRVQSIEFQTISRTASESLLRKHHITEATKLQQMLFIASGLPAELVRLADDKEYFENKARYVRLARDFLTGGMYDRLALISQINGRSEALLFTATIASVLRFTSERDPDGLTASQSETLETVTSRLLGNSHVRSQLMYLAISVV